MTTLIWVELANQRWGDVSRTLCFTRALVASSVILGNEKQTEKMGCLFLLKIMAYQTTFQDLHLNQLKAFLDLLPRMPLRKWNLLTLEPSIIIMSQVRTTKGSVMSRK